MPQIRLFIRIVSAFLSQIGFFAEKLQAQTQKPRSVQFFISAKPLLTKEVIRCVDTVCVKEIIQKTIQEQIWVYGNYTCRVDSIVSDSLHVVVYLSSAKHPVNIQLRPGNVPTELIASFSKTLNKSMQKGLTPSVLQELYERIIQHQENNGHPFATLILDSLRWKSDTLQASLLLSKNSRYLIDSIQIEGNVRVNPTYLQQYIEIKPQDFYSESKIKNISGKLSEWSFASLKEPVRVRFTPNKASLKVVLQKKKSSNFYGIVGILPDAEGKVKITGEARLKLENALGRAELMQLEWKRIQNNTQNLHTKLAYPYLLNLPVGIAFELDLFRKDTSFSNVNTKYALNYLLNAKDYVQVFLAQKKSNLLSVTSPNIIDLNYLDIDATQYGLGLFLQKVDYLLNPSKGLLLDVSGAAGIKNIRQNPRINAEKYDSLTLKTEEFTLKAHLQYFVPIKGALILKIGTQNQYLINQNLFENEFYRIGGLFTLRGFDEESIYASSYSIASIEPRFLLEKNSFLYLFFDAAYYQNKTKTREIKGYPYSFGSGISFETKSGIFTFSYALGRSIFYENQILKDNGFSLRSGKIHFGFINYF